MGVRLASARLGRNRLILDLTNDEAEALDLLLDAFFEELQIRSVEPEGAFVTLAAKVGVGRFELADPVNS